MMLNAHRIGAALLCVTLCSQAEAQSFRVKVGAKDDIYRAGETDLGRRFGVGKVPPSVTLPIGTQCVTFSKVTGSHRCASREGCITIDGHEAEGTHYNDPDGFGAYPPTSSSTGKRSISGITAPLAGYLVGLFTPAGGPSGSAPVALDLTTGKGTSFRRPSPRLDQSFFVGDGRTGNSTGQTQKFSVPANASTLYLGISDAAGFNGAPGACFDNTSSFKVIVHASPIACPS